MNNSKLKVLCFLDIDHGRDPEILLPLVIFSEKFLNCTIEFAFIWDIHAIYRKRPDMVLLANAIGSKLHFEITKYAHQQSITVFTLISEGNFRTDGTFNYWGYNTEKKIYQEYVCHWSKRTQEFLSDKIPQQKNKMALTGATGFDRYKVYEFQSRQEFFREQGIKPDRYKRVICYAGWAFGKLFNEQGRREIRNSHKNDPNRMKWMEEQMYQVENILKELIEYYPDTLFILKRHPNEANPSIVGKGMNEMVRLENYDNVLYLTEKVNIHDLIHVSDILLAFESTTTMESWIMRKNPTILINPDPDFKRDKLYKGSLIARNFDQLKAYLEEFYATGSITEFHSKDLKENREQLIRDTVGFDDGLNHIRAGYYFEKSLRKAADRQKKFKFNIRYFIMYLLMTIGQYLYWKDLFVRLPKFKKTIWIFEYHKLSRLPDLKSRYTKFIEQFYKNSGLNDENKYKLAGIVENTNDEER
jgi:surface carbohydrate biosynthesis protein